MVELAAPESDQIPSSDPLLKSDAFIDATVNGDGDTFSRDQTVLDPEPLARRSPIEAEPVSVVKVTGDIEEVTPVASSKNSTFPEASQRCSELSLVNESSVRPDWLPPDWRTEYRVRSTGATAGHTDKVRYYEIFGITGFLIFYCLKKSLLMDFSLFLSLFYFGERHLV